MRQGIFFRSRQGARVLVLMFIALVAFSSQAGKAEAIPAKCFGKKINRVISGDNKKVRLDYKDVTWIAGNKVTVTGKPYSRICAGDGRQIIHAGKGTSYTDTGAGDDTIKLHASSNNSKAYGGPGDDELIGSNGNDFLYGSPENAPGGKGDADRIEGGGGNDQIFDYGGEGNKLLGQNGSDQIHSLGKAVSELHGGNGSDFLFSNGGRSAGGTLEKLFGEQGNDRIQANQPNNNGPAYLDGGEGDDRMYGSPQGDTIIYNSGIKKVYGLGGDDLFVTTARGQGTFEGGDGRDTISFAASTPSERPNSITGVKVDLGAGTSLGYSGYDLSGIENVIGSAFDDEIVGAPGVDNDIQAGLGDDEIIGQNGDTVDGGLGVNDCSGGQQTNCNGQSPGDPGAGDTQVDITEGGLLIVIGSISADTVSVGYSGASGRFEVKVTGGGLASGLCTSAGGGQINCPVDPNSLNGMLIYGDDGADQITLENSIPKTLTATINGGTGNNTITGGPDKDFISTAPGSAGSTIQGGDGLDVLYAMDKVSLVGGPDTDIFRIVDPCLGASLTGNAGTDSVVFAGAASGVKASLAGGYAQWLDRSCGEPTSIAKDIEKLEGTESDDWLIVGKRNKSQDGRSVLFGRGGIDTLDARNGSIDSVTTGSGGHANKVIADRKDKVVWGYGLAGY